MASRGLQRGAALAAEVPLDADNTLERVRSLTDPTGRVHARYRQFFRGVPVWPLQVVLTTHQGRVRASGELAEGLAQAVGSVIPVLDASSALRLAREAEPTIPRDTPRRPGTLLFSNEKAELILYTPASGSARLAYLVSYFADVPGGGSPTRPFLVIDAEDGKALTSWQGLTYALVGTGPGGNLKTGEYEYGTDFGYLDVAVAGSTYTMNSTQVKTVDLNHGTSGETAYSYTGPRNTYQYINGAYSPLNDAHYFGRVVFDMYSDWYATAPLAFQLVMHVHYSTNFENAFWSGSGMYFGDGYTTFYPLVSLDVSAHEVSHGFTEQNSDLIYSGQSGGINEAFSDLAGEAAEYFSRGSCDYLVGAEIFKAPDEALRYLANPPLDGHSIGHVSDYYDGMDVHYSSGVFNKAYYLLAHTSGWNAHKAFDPFVRANQYYWTPSTDFYSGAEGVLNAAEDLGYGTNAVIQAFQQVGIDLTQPYFQVLEPDSSNPSAVGSFTLRWSDLDRDHDAQIAFYYSVTNTGSGGTLIVSGLSEDDEADQYVWDLSSVPLGSYYIRGVMTNGVDTTSDWSPGRVTVVQGDAYEPDDAPAQASWASLGGVQEHHSIVPETDIDWVKFNVDIVPNSVTIETNGASGDTRLWLYDPTGSVQLAYDDDSGTDLFSRLTYVIATPGTYNVKVDEYGNSNLIADYLISFQGLQASPTVTPTITPTSTPTPIVSPTPTATISPVVSPTPTRTATVTLTPTPHPGTGVKDILPYPNPARSVVHFVWSEPGVDEVRVHIYNSAGEPVAELTQSHPGYRVTWQTSDAAPGVYLYRVELRRNGQDVQRKTGKIAIVK